MLTIIALPAAVSADILYDNFGPGDTYSNGGYLIGGTDAQEFGPSFAIGGGDFFLDTVVAAVGHSFGVNQVTLSLYDSSGGLPGNVLETSVLGGLPDFGSGDPPSTFNFSGLTVLENGETYFLIASSVNDGNASLTWNFNSTDDIGRASVRQNAGAWSAGPFVMPAFRVNGIAVPEPGALALLSIAAIGHLISERRRRRR